MLLFKKCFYEAIAGGAKTTTLRRWRRPMVRPGSVHIVPHLGQLRIDAVHTVESGELTEAHARADGFACLADLHAALGALYGPADGDDRRLYLVRFTFVPASRP